MEILEAVGAGNAEVVGPGNANFKGPVDLTQSHCVRRTERFSKGRFTLTNAYTKTIEGRYCGDLVPTFNSYILHNPSESICDRARQCLHRRQVAEP